MTGWQVIRFVLHGKSRGFMKILEVDKSARSENWTMQDLNLWHQFGKSGTCGEYHLTPFYNFYLRC